MEKMLAGRKEQKSKNWALNAAPCSPNLNPVPCILHPILFFLAFLLLLSASGVAFAAVKLKIAVVNPSSTEKQSSPVRYDLPKGVGPGQIVDIGGLEMKYDFDKGNYYLAGSLELAPSERKVLEVTLRDVWTIPKNDLIRFKDHVALLIKKLKDTKHFQAGEALSKDINARLDGMIKKDNDATLAIKDRINQYFEDLVVLDGVRENIGMLENLVLDIGGIVEERVQVPATLAVPIPHGKTDGLQTDANVIELKAKVTNPSQDKILNTPVKFSLPVEVSPKHILNRSGMDMAYDFDKETFSLYKDEVELAPGETKEFSVKIQDMWKIDKVEIDALLAHTHNIMILLEGGEHYSRAKVAEAKINANMTMILKSQNAKVSAVEHIAYYRDNIKLLNEAKKEVAELERLVSQRGTSVGVTVKWAEEAGGGSLLVRKKGYEGIDLIAQSIFRGKAPTIATTWKIIYGIIAFLGILSMAVFFHIIRRRWISEFDPLTGSYRRDAFMENADAVLKSCQKRNVQAAFLLLDLDKFKLMNDQFGHDFGDTVLKEFMWVLRSHLRHGDVVGRYGGDEFVIALANIGRSNAEKVAEKVRNAVKNHVIKDKSIDQEIHFSTSIGVALYPEAGQTLEQLFLAADAAMYRSKAAGGNAVNFA